MSLLLSVQGRAVAPSYGGVGSVRDLAQTAMGALRVSSFGLPGLEDALAGFRFGGGCQVIAEGIAPVSAIPTTTAAAALYNPVGSGYVLVIDWLSCFLGSGTAAAGATLLACSSGQVATAPTAATSYSAANLAGRNKLSVAVWGKALTIPAGVWLGVQPTFQLAAANVGQGFDKARLGGAFVIGPGKALGLAVLSGAGTSPLYQISASWLELPLTAEIAA